MHLLAGLKNLKTRKKIKMNINKLRVCFRLFVILLSVDLHSSWPKSAFGELQIADLSARVQLEFPYGINSRYVTTTVTGSGTVTQANSMALLQTGAASSSSAQMVSRTRVRFRPGQGAECLVTAIFTTGVSGSTQITGVGNSTDGFFFGYNGTSFGILFRNSATGSLVDTWIAQTAWNVDKYNGTGASGVTLDQTKGNIYKVQYQAAFGTISFYIANPATGAFDLVHQIKYDNANLVPSLSNPALQIMSQVINTTNSTNIQLRNCSLGAFLQGIFTNVYLRNNISTSKLITSTFTNVITLRNNTEFPYGSGITNQIMVYPDEITVFNRLTGSGDVIYTLYSNPSVTGSPVWTNVNATTSCMSYDTAGVLSAGTGYALFTFYISNGQSFTFNLYDYAVRLLPGETLMLAARTTTSTETIFSSISWREHQ